MVDISSPHVRTHRNLRRYLKEERPTLATEFTESMYVEVTSAIKKAMADNEVRQPDSPGVGDYVHLSLLALGNEDLANLGIGEIEIYYYPKTGKLRTNVYSLGQSLDKSEAIRISKEPEILCESYFSEHDTATIIRATESLLQDPKSEKHVSFRNFAKDELKEAQLKILTDKILDNRPIPQDLLIQLEKEARSLDLYEQSYDGSLISIPTHIRSILLNGSKTEYDSVKVYRGPSILTREAHERVENESLAMVESNERQQPVRIIKLHGNVVYPIESANQQTLDFFTSKGIMLPVGKFSRFGHLICVTEATYQEMLKKGIEAGQATVSLPPQTLDVIKGLIYLNNEIPYINLIYRQKEDWSEDIAQKETEFKRLSERYLRSYIELMIDQLEKGKTDYNDADSEVFVEKRKMVDSTRKAIYKLKSMKGREDDVEISDSFIYGSVMLLILNRKYKSLREKEQKKLSLERSIMERLEAASLSSDHK